MPRAKILTAGYGALGASFLALAGSAYVGVLLVPGLLLALVGAFLLAFSDDDIPKWAGVVLIVYFLLLALAFAFASSVTVRTGGRFHIESPSPQLAEHVLYYLGLASPLVLAGAGLAATWERPRVVRYLFISALAGMVLVGILTLALTPAIAPPGEDAAAQARFATDVARAQALSRLIQALGALSAVAAATGAFWSAAKPEEYG